jgi:hypothetical protein
MEDAQVQAVPVQSIQPGSWFRKKHGTYAYLRIGADSAKAMSLDWEARIYGVAFNGNMVAVKPDTEVIPCTILTYLRNVSDQEDLNCILRTPQRSMASRLAGLLRALYEVLSKQDQEELGHE